MAGRRRPAPTLSWTGTVAATPIRAPGENQGSKPLLRSVIELHQAVTPDNLRNNWERLRKSGLRWQRPDDAKLYARIQAYWDEHEEAPAFATLMGQAEAADDLELIQRLKDIAFADVMWATNFGWLLKTELESQRDIETLALLRCAADIISKGVKLEGRTLKGRTAACTWLADQLARVQPHGPAIASLSAAEVFEPLPAVPWACEGLRLTPVAGVTMFAGYGDSCKSITAQHIALAFASGLPIFGTHAVKRGRVLHLDYEQGSFLTRERYQRVARGMGLEAKALIEGDWLRLAVFPRVKLDDDEAEDSLRTTVQGFDVVLIDSNRASSPSTEENSSEARVPLDMVARVCDGRVLPVVIHHGRKPTKDNQAAGGGARMNIRGSSALFDALGGCFVFGREDGEELIRVSHEKERIRGVKLAEFCIRVTDVAHNDDPKWGLRVETVSKQDAADHKAEAVDAKLVSACAKVLQLVIDHPGIGGRDLRARSPVKGVALLERCLAHLVDTGHAVEEQARNERNQLTTVYRPLRTAYTTPAKSAGMSTEAPPVNLNLAE
jgi:hypothetical protein